MGYGQSEAFGYAMARELREERLRQDKRRAAWAQYDRKVAQEIADDVRRLTALRKVFKAEGMDFEGGTA